MSERVLDPLTLLSAADKAGLLVPRIRDRVKLSCQDYHKLLEYLRLNWRKHGSIVDILDKEYDRETGLHSSKNLTHKIVWHRRPMST